MRIFILFLIAPLIVIMPVFAAKKSARKSAPKAEVSHDQELKTREYMIEISRQMGVTCNYCHDVKNFRDSSMKTWKVSKEHMRIVDILNHQGFKNGPVTNCY